MRDVGEYDSDGELVEQNPPLSSCFQIGAPSAIVPAFAPKKKAFRQGDRHGSRSSGAN